MAADTTRVLRGALAGAVAAGVWGAQQPLDKRFFGVDYDDAELLGSALTRRRGTPATFALGHVLHVLNGAVFGAAYAAISPAVGGPGPARGAVAGLLEHAATWPLTRFLPAAHPAGASFPPLWGDRRALAQATWRHLLFGTVLGAVEERLNPPPGEAAPADEDHSTTNGHGNVEHLVVTKA
jgi:hypothetical protein